MRRHGYVVAARAPDRVTVELESGTTCARCASGHGCGAALFASAAEPVRLDCVIVGAERGGLAPAGGPRVGTRVELELTDDGSRWLVPVVLAYGLPTLGLVAGACAPEPWTPFAALAGLGGGLLAWRVAGAWFGAGDAGRIDPAGSARGAGWGRPVARMAHHRDSRISPGENA